MCLQLLPLNETEIAEITLQRLLFPLPSYTFTYQIMGQDPSVKAVQSKGAAIQHSSGGKIAYAY